MRAENLAGDITGEIRQTLGRVRANRVPGNRRPGFSYARVVRTAFEDIRELLAEGFSFAVICEALEADGLLREGSRPYSLSRAMRREGIRRRKLAEVAKMAETRRFPDDADRTSRAAETSLKVHEGEHEWVRKITGSTEETGLGKLTKHSDGSFDFDWK